MLYYRWQSYQRSHIFIKKYHIYSYKRPHDKNSRFQAHLEQATDDYTFRAGRYTGCTLALDSRIRWEGEDARGNATIRWANTKFFLDKSFLQSWNRLHFPCKEKFPQSNKIKRQQCMHHTGQWQWEVHKSTGMQRRQKMAKGCLQRKSMFPRGGFEGNFKAYLAEMGKCWYSMGPSPGVLCHDN